MKILYVTDLHGDKNKYRKSLEIAMKQEIRVIVNGGDMLPKLGERHTEQPLFIKGFLSNYFSILQEHNITLHILICWGMTICYLWIIFLNRLVGDSQMFII